MHVRAQRYDRADDREPNRRHPCFLQIAEQRQANCPAFQTDIDVPVGGRYRFTTHCENGFRGKGRGAFEMTDMTLHERCVTAWLESRGARQADATRMTELLLAGLQAILERARPSLGDVTVAAIVQRAVHTAERRHRELAQLGLRVTDGATIGITSSLAPRVELRAAVAFVLTEVLQVLGGLTADALTPALHAALAAAADESPAFTLLRSSPGRRDGRDDERGTT